MSGNPNVESTRVYVDCVADLFHHGHVRLYARAKRMGENVTLVVGVHNDLDVASYKRFPVMTLAERAEVVRSCRYVDEVIENAPLRISEDYLRKNRINLVVHGSDISPESEKMMYSVPIKLGIYRKIDYSAGISTTDVIERIISRCSGNGPPLNRKKGNVIEDTQTAEKVTCNTANNLQSNQDTSIQ